MIPYLGLFGGEVVGRSTADAPKRSHQTYAVCAIYSRDAVGSILLPIGEHVRSFR